MSSTSKPQRPRNRFFDRLTEPFADMARETMGQAEDRVRDAIQAEIDSVGASVRHRAVQIRPSAIGFGVAALITFFGLALFVTAAVIGLSYVLDPWAAALALGGTLVLIGAGAAAWARRRLQNVPPMTVVRAPQTVHPAEEQVHPWAD